MVSSPPKVKRAAPPAVRGDASERGQSSRGQATRGNPGSTPIQHFPRQRSALDKLEIEWTFPVYIPAGEREGADESMYGASDKGALPREDAFLQIAGDDPRPLVLMRECTSCEGTDDALLSTTLDNERTQLLSRWFRMVKLPTHVLQADHSFHALFEDNGTPHVIVCSNDGRHAQPLAGDQSQSDTWNAMVDVLRSNYRKDPERALEDVSKLLDKYDRIDSAENRIHDEIESRIERDGPKSSKVKKLRKELDKLVRERQRLDDEFAKASDLGSSVH